MNWVALKMLTGDRGKYLGIVFGVTFAALLIAQQSVDLLRPDAAHRPARSATSTGPTSG